jgi:hypothetical protein
MNNTSGQKGGRLVSSFWTLDLGCETYSAADLDLSSEVGQPEMHPTATRGKKERRYSLTSESIFFAEEIKPLGPAAI